MHHIFFFSLRHPMKGRTTDKKNVTMVVPTPPQREDDTNGAAVKRKPIQRGFCWSASVVFYGKIHPTKGSNDEERLSPSQGNDVTRIEKFHARGAPHFCASSTFSPFGLRAHGAIQGERSCCYSSQRALKLG
jgi:hypothetical protein